MVEVEGLDPSAPLYISGFLHKKEESWVEYWMVLREVCLFIHSAKPAQQTERDLLIGWIEISTETRCIMGKKRGYSFQFYVRTNTGKYLFKTDSTLARHRWVTAIKLCAQRKSPHLVPQHLTQVDRREDLQQVDRREDLQQAVTSNNSSSHDEVGDVVTCDSNVGDSECVSNDNVGDEVGDLSDDPDNGDEFVSSKIILVSTNCANVVRNFVGNGNLPRISFPVPKEEATPFMNLVNRTNTVTSQSKLYLYEEKPVNLGPPKISRNSNSAGTRSCFSKSADSVEEMNLLQTSRSKSETDVGMRSSGRNIFSRHLLDKEE